MLLFGFLILPFSVSFNSILTQNCYIQIVSVTLNQSSFEIGEHLQMNLVYDLYYDPTDPLGIGSVSVSVHADGNPTPLFSKEITDVGYDINKIITFDISPNDWAPNETGQAGELYVEGWAQDSFGSMTDSVQQQFAVRRSELILSCLPLPSQITYHEIFNIEGKIQNPHNSSLDVPNQPIVISAIRNNTILLNWNIYTNLTSNFKQSVNTTQLCAGDFVANITVLESNDYKSIYTTDVFSIANASLDLTVTSNSSVIEAYYPSATNCSVFVVASVYCQGTNHTLEEANVTCQLSNSSILMDYFAPNSFSAVVYAPSNPGNYSINITAVVPNHDPISTSIPLEVVYRQAQISFTSNRSEAAYGDIIGFSLSINDSISQVPISNKICFVYLYNQSGWALLKQVLLDQNGRGLFSWQAQDLGTQDFRFRVAFQGQPEFDYEEVELTIINTRDIRFICMSTLEIIRPSNVTYIVQLTTLDFQPLFNISISLIETSTNSTWEIAYTNSSGYATLTWFIDSNYYLGPHDFYIMAQDGMIILGTIPLTMIIFEQTILEIV